MNYTAEQV